MTPPRIWRGVRMRDTAAGADPDAPPRPLSLPAAWDDRAAAALAALAPGAGRATLPRAAEGWIRPLAARAHQAGGAALADRLHALLLHRRAAPTEPVWGLMGTAADVPGFVLNLPAFHDGAHGFDAAGFADAVTTAATALHLGYPGGARFALGVTDLDGLLAVLGLEYDSPAARDVARAIAALLRATADLAFAGNQPDLLSRHPSWPPQRTRRDRPPCAARAGCPARPSCRPAPPTPCWGLRPAASPRPSPPSAPMVR